MEDERQHLQIVIYLEIRYVINENRTTLSTHTNNRTKCYKS